MTSIAAAGDHEPAVEIVPTRWTPLTISSEHYESSPTFTPDGKELYFMRSDKQFRNWRILQSRCESTGWSVPQEVPFAAPAPIGEADPFVTIDGKRLYYVSTRPLAGEPKEDLDIWYVDRLADGRWSTPQRAPEPINSAGSELLPRQLPNGDLYFGSSRDGGLGKTDIYRARRLADGTWKVSNLGVPVNSAEDEYEADISRNGNTLVLVANRGTRSHLYRYRWQNDQWQEQATIPAFENVFQVGPLLSPSGDRLLFAQSAGEPQSGELFLVDLAEKPNTNWPPSCET